MRSTFQKLFNTFKTTNKKLCVTYEGVGLTSIIHGIWNVLKNTTDLLTLLYFINDKVDYIIPQIYLQNNGLVNNYYINLKQLYWLPSSGLANAPINSKNSSWISTDIGGC